MNTDLLIFDFDGVIINSTYDDFKWAAEARKKLAERKGWNIDWRGFEQTIFSVHYNQDFDQIRREKDVSWNQIKMMEETVIDRKLEKVENGEIEVYSDAEKIIKSLNQDKAIITNSYGGYLPEILSKLDIQEYFNYIDGPKISDIENYRKRMKPSPTMLEKIIQKAEASNPVMIGDQIEDILAARRAGIKSVYLGRNGGKESKADLNIKSLDELNDI